MAVAVSSSDVERKPRIGGSGNNYIRSQYFADGPQAFRIEFPEPRGVIKPHFHRVNQFQVIVNGSGHLGKTPVTPIAFHYADAFTPYGPIVADDDGISFFTIRAIPDHSGAHYMPESRGEMERKAGRNIARHMTTGVPLTGDDPAAVEILIESHSDQLAAFALRARPGMAFDGLPTDRGGGQYCMVAHGLARYEGKELPPLSCIWVARGSIAPRFVAGDEGVELLVLQFPEEAG
ncbi:MAG: hypothetical protein AB7R89_10335 [Dehalococcoidia bacterium]